MKSFCIALGVQPVFKLPSDVHSEGEDTCLLILCVFPVFLFYTTLTRRYLTLLLSPTDKLLLRAGTRLFTLTASRVEGLHARAHVSKTERPTFPDPAIVH